MLYCSSLLLKDLCLTFHDWSTKSQFHKSTVAIHKWWKQQILTCDIFILIASLDSVTIVPFVSPAILHNHPRPDNPTPICARACSSHLTPSKFLLHPSLLMRDLHVGSASVTALENREGKELVQFVLKQVLQT